MVHMPGKCEECGRNFYFPTCEFCRREKEWNLREKEKTMNRFFTPRQIRDMDTFRSNKLDEFVKNLTNYLFTSSGKTGLGVYIYNPETRTGKTVLATFLFMQIAKHLFIHNLPTTVDCMAFTSIHNILEDARNSFKTENNGNSFNFRKYMNLDWLFIDDFGVDKITEWVYEFIYTLINHRYEYMKPTIFTSNVPLNQLEEVLHDSRIPSRIGRMCSSAFLYDYRTIPTI